MPRPMTMEEMRAEFIQHVRGTVEYWRNQDADDPIGGVAFSILVAIDGMSAGLPAFDLIPRPHPDDEQYHRDEGENWWNPVSLTRQESLHDLFYA